MNSWKIVGCAPHIRLIDFQFQSWAILDCGLNESNRAWLAEDLEGQRSIRTVVKATFYEYVMSH